MIPGMTSLFISGVIICIIGFVIGAYFALRSEWSSPKWVMPLFVGITLIGLSLIAIDGYQEISKAQKYEKEVSNNIELMACNQLHDALLHNKINGTDHVQRATERYVAGCETK